MAFPPKPLRASSRLRSVRSASSSATSAPARSTRSARRSRRRPAAAVPDGEVLGVLSLILWTLTLIVSIKYVHDPAARRQPRRGRDAVADGAGAARLAQAVALGDRSSASSARRCSTATPRSRRRSRCSRRSKAWRSRRRASRPFVVPLTLAHPHRPVRRAAHRHRTGLVLLRADHRALVRRAGASRARRRAARSVGARGDQSVLCRRTSWSTHEFIAFVTLGAVFLCVTGAEALYADLGHFGRRPIRVAWYVRRLSGAGAQLSRPGRPGAEHPRRARTRSTCCFPTGRSSRS